MDIKNNSFPLIQVAVLNCFHPGLLLLWIFNNFGGFDVVRADRRTGALDESSPIVASQMVDILPVLSVLENIDVIRLALLDVDDRLDQPVILFDSLVVTISKLIINRLHEFPTYSLIAFLFL